MLEITYSWTGAVPNAEEVAFVEEKIRDEIDQRVPDVPITVRLHVDPMQFAAIGHGDDKDGNTWVTVEFSLNDGHRTNYSFPRAS